MAQKTPDINVFYLLVGHQVVELLPGTTFVWNGQTRAGNPLVNQARADPASFSFWKSRVYCPLELLRPECLVFAKRCFRVTTTRFLRRLGSLNRLVQFVLEVAVFVRLRHEDGVELSWRQPRALGKRFDVGLTLGVCVTLSLVLLGRIQNRTLHGHFVGSFQRLQIESFRVLFFEKGRENLVCRNSLLCTQF